MIGFDRDPALERQQIHEIAINVARRLLLVLDRISHAPPRIAAEIEAGANLISEIQRETSYLLASLPAPDALDVGTLTHMLGRQEQALGLLELLESRTASLGLESQRTPFAALPPPDFGPIPRYSDPLSDGRQREFANRRAASTLIEQSAAGYPYPPGSPLPPSRQLAHYPGQVPGARPGTPGHAPRRPPPGTAPRQPPTSGGPPGPRRPPQPGRKRPPRHGLAGVTPWLASARAFAAKPASLASLAGIVVATGLAVCVQTLMDQAGNVPGIRTASSLPPGPKLDGRLDHGGAEQRPETGQDAPAPGLTSTAQAAGLTPAAAGEPPQGAETPSHAALSMEQPFLVVLSTRQSTAELQQDFRAYKETYPSILGDARARVDQVQGQDRQIWHRLSLIPPLSHDDAKALCGNLKASGFTGCWIKPLPMTVAPQ